jgi:Flp pilus assembly protein TadB
VPNNRNCREPDGYDIYVCSYCVAKTENVWDHGQVRMGDLLVRLDRAFAPYYLLAAGFGALCFIANLTLNTGRMRLIALVWVVVVPLWIQRYRQHRNARRRR